MNNPTATPWLTCREAASYPQCGTKHTLNVDQRRQSQRILALRHQTPCLALPPLRSRCYAHSAVRCSLEREGLVRARNRSGSVVLDKRIKTWNFFFWENGKRRSKKIGTMSQYPTKASAWRAAKSLRHSLENEVKVSSAAPTVSTLVEQYRAEKMPTRLDHESRL